MFVIGVVLFVTVVPYFAVLLVAGSYANIVLVMGVALVVIGWGHCAFSGSCNGCYSSAGCTSCCTG